MKLHYKPDELLEKLEPSEMGMEYTSAQRLELKGGIEIPSNEEELCFVFMDGCASYESEGKRGTAEKLDMLYVPRDSKIFLKSDNCLIMQFGARCSKKTSFAHIPFNQVDKDYRHKVYGKEELGTKRDVWNFIDEKFDCCRFLIGLCKGSNGGWTAWPPHEHAKEREETYVYFNMGDSFGIQLVYDDLEHPYTVALVRDGHLVAVPRGYHPSCGSPAGGIFYVYCMASKTEFDRDFMNLRTQKIFGDKLE